MVQVIKTILQSGVEPARRYLETCSCLQDLGEEKKKILQTDSIQIISGDGIEANGWKFDKVKDEVKGEGEQSRFVLKVNAQKGQEILKALTNLEEIKDKGVEEGKKDDVNAAYVYSTQDESTQLSGDEQKSQGVLENINAFLSRAYDRRTNMSSWLLLAVLNTIGFKGYSEVEEVLKSPDFIKKYSGYLKAKDEQEVKNIFEGDDERKIKLAKLCYFFTRAFKNIPSPFRDWFPVIFSLQNISMPLLARAFKEHSIGKIFDLVRMVNPWIGDFCGEILGNFKQEIKNVKDIQDTDEKAKVISEVKLLDLTHEEYGLQKVVRKVNEAFERIFGKNTTLSSWCLKTVLWFSSKGQEDYQKFASKFVDSSEFIKDLHEYLKMQSPTEKDFKSRFKERSEGIVANIIIGVVKIARSLTPSFIQNSSNWFGLPYSIQNLTMPIIAKFVNRGFLGFIVHFLRDVNPLINDLFMDHIGNFRKEILDVQKENAVKLFPEARGLDKSIKYAKSLWYTIRAFVSGKAIEPAT